MIPYIDKLKRRHVRQETIRLDYQKIMFKDGMIFQVSAMLLFTVTDVFKAMFEIEDLGDAVETLGLAILREELSSRSHKDLADHEKIGKALLDLISQKGEEWGVKFHAFKLTDLSTGQKMRRNLLYDIKRSEQMASLFDKNDDVELWP
jgi:regulator of protease activity HflC (stomatin/prohibitin superfamily)